MQQLSSLPGYEASRLTFHLMAQQGESGVVFDVDKAAALREFALAEMLKIEGIVEPQLPPRPLKKSEQDLLTAPAKPFKQDGTLSAHGQKFLDTHGLELIGVDHIQWQGELIRYTGGLALPSTAKMTLRNQSDIKDYFMRPQPKKEAVDYYDKLIWRE